LLIKVSGGKRPDWLHLLGVKRIKRGRKLFMPWAHPYYEKTAKKGSEGKLGLARVGCPPNRKTARSILR